MSLDLEKRLAKLEAEHLTLQAEHVTLRRRIAALERGGVASFSSTEDRWLRLEDAAAEMRICADTMKQRGVDGGFAVKNCGRWEVEMTRAHAARVGRPYKRLV